MVENNLHSKKTDVKSRQLFAGQPRSDRYRIALYSHDTMGLGHMRRNLLIAHTLSESELNPTILMIAGGKELNSYPLPADLDCLILPSYHKGLSGKYKSRNLDISGIELADMRANTIKCALKSFQPDLFIVDNVARGALGELEPALQSLRKKGSSRCILGLRDIQDNKDVAHAQYLADEQSMREFYDAIWIYGDPAVYDRVSEDNYATDIRAKTKYTGYLDQSSHISFSQGPSGNDELIGLGFPPGPLVLCILGGGQDGERLAEAFVRTNFPDNYNALLITGPYMPSGAKHSIYKAASNKPRLRVLEFVPELTALVEQADRVITMGGYNSVCEVLSFGKRSLIVPRTEPRQEQWLRAKRLEELQLVHMLHPAKVTPEAISAWLSRKDIQTPNVREKLNMSGVETIQRLVKDVAGTIGRNNMSYTQNLKVGYVLKMYPRFSETFIVNEILAHEAAGLDIEIFSLRPPNDGRFHEVLAKVRAPVIYLPSAGLKTNRFWADIARASEQFPRLWTVLASTIKEKPSDIHQAILLAEAVKASGITHLHAHFGSVATTVARLAALISELPYSFTAHAKDIFHASVDSNDLRVKLRDASNTITVSNYNLNYLKSNYGEAARNVLCIYNGIDLNRFTYSKPDNRPAEIITVGRLVEKKGFTTLIEACALLAKSDRLFSCTIIGKGPLEQQLRQKIQDFDLEKQVRLLGPKSQEDVVKLVQGASVFAAPCVIGSDGNRDGMPTVLLEAMALGTPCVATDVTGIPELVLDGETGLMVPQHDPESLAAALERLLSDTELCIRLAGNARRLIESKFDIVKNTAVLRTYYQQQKPDELLSLRPLCR